MNKETIDFAVFLTGHDEETIRQMYRDWSNKNTEQSTDKCDTCLFSAKCTIKDMVDVGKCGCALYEPTQEPVKEGTNLITLIDGFCGEMQATECCGIAPITSEKYCPECGKKINNPNK